MPKFKYYYSPGKIAQSLSKLGMKDAFSGEADFSGISPQKPLFIDRVEHSSYISVDEKGTEAAAATLAFGTTAGSPPPKPVDFIANRPFIYLIQHVKTGTILFMGRVMDPSQN